MSEAFQFEGDEVTDFVVQMPAATLEAPEAFPRGTLLTLTVQVRVKSVRLEEDRQGNLIRKHILALDEAAITDTLTPQRRIELIELAAQQAAQEPFTVQEEPTVEDVVPGQLTIDEVVAEQAAEQADAYARTHTPPEGDKWATGAFPVDTAAFLEPPVYDKSIDNGAEVKFDYVPTDEDRKVTSAAEDDNDPEHAWMDEDEEDGVQVVIVGNDRYAVDF